jgi:hypothetical protein
MSRALILLFSFFNITAQAHTCPLAKTRTTQFRPCRVRPISAHSRRLGRHDFDRAASAFPDIDIDLVTGGFFLCFNVVSLSLAPYISIYVYNPPSCKMRGSFFVYVCNYMCTPSLIQCEDFILFSNESRMCFECN